MSRCAATGLFCEIANGVASRLYTGRDDSDLHGRVIWRIRHTVVSHARR